MSRKAIKSINWAALAERIPESEKNMLASFRAKSDQYLRSMVAYPETAPKIDWTYYKKNIPISGLVEKFQKEYDALSIPYPADKYTNLIEAEEKDVLADIEKFIQESNQRMEQCNKEIAAIKALIPIDQMTMEDCYDEDPERAVRADRPTAWPHLPEDQFHLLGKMEEVKKEMEAGHH